MRTKLNHAQVKRIMRKRGMPAADIAATYGVSAATILKVWAGRHCLQQRETPEAPASYKLTPLEAVKILMRPRETSERLGVEFGVSAPIIYAIRNGTHPLVAERDEAAGPFISRRRL